MITTSFVSTGSFLRVLRASGIGIILALGASGCRATLPSTPAIHGAEHARAQVKQARGHELAPLVFADAEQSLAAASAAEKAGDALAAELLAEHALASYQRTLALARRSRAVEEETRASAALAKASDDAAHFARERQGAEQEALELERRVKIARESERPAPSGPADSTRERARLVAAQSLLAQARLLCSAARLIATDAPGLQEAESEVSALETQSSASAPIDRASRVRAACLSALTRARRPSGSPPGASHDATERLFVELTRAGSGATRKTLNANPVRDERGIILTFRSLFDRDKLSQEGATVLKELGRVASAHTGFGVQVVFHDATPSPREEATRTDARAEAIRQALVDGGAPGAKIAIEHAGTRAPVFDPSDPKRRAQNARVEVVFVSL